MNDYKKLEDAYAKRHRQPYAYDEFNEADHPRDESGKFGSGGSSSGGERKTVREASGKVRNLTAGEISGEKQEATEAVDKLKKQISQHKELYKGTLDYSAENHLKDLEKKLKKKEKELKQLG